MRSKSLVLLMAILCGLTACSTGARKGPAAKIVTDGEQSMLDDNMDQTFGVDGASSFAGDDFGGGQLGYSDGSKLTDQDQRALQIMTANIPNKIYFETNKFELSDQSKKDLNISAAFLNRYPNVHIMVSGHADPRGSEDFNFHLGQRRANAARDHLIGQGIQKDRVCTVSYGELRPAASPSDYAGDWKEAYRLDRRSEVEFGKMCEGLKRG